MATEKLSDFTASTPALSDYVAGATLGSPNKKFLVSNVGFPPAGANLAFHVATTGSDSNPGTLAQPFATIQHAIDTALSFNYKVSWYANIFVADGTYNEFPSLNFPLLEGASPNDNPFITANLGIIGNHSTPANCVISGGGFSFDFAYSVCGLDGFLFSNGGFIFGQFGTLNYGNLSFSGTSNFIFQLFGVGVILQPFGNSVIDLSGCTTISTFCQADDAGGSVIFFGCTFILPTLTLGGEWFQVTVLLLEWANNSFTNFVGISGSRGVLGPYAQIATDHGVETDIPGTVTATVDNTVEWLDEANQSKGLAVYQISGTPTTSNLPATTWGVFKDTSGGGVYVAYNDAGTIKKVALT